MITSLHWKGVSNERSLAEPNLIHAIKHYCTAYGHGVQVSATFISSPPSTSSSGSDKLEPAEPSSDRTGPPTAGGPSNIIVVNACEMYVPPADSVVLDCRRSSIKRLSRIDVILPNIRDQRQRVSLVEEGERTLHSMSRSSRGTNDKMSESTRIDSEIYLP